MAGLEDELTEVPETESDNNETDEEPTIVVADGAFDSLAAHMESEKAEWQYIKKLCQQDSELPIRIGSIRIAEPAELCIGGKILHE